MLAGDLYMGNQNQINGTIKEFSSVPEVQIAGEQFTADGASLNIANNQTYYFQPGVYGDVRVYSRAIISFQSGEYFFRSLIIEPDVRVTINSLSGPVYLKIVNGLSLGDRTEIINASPGLLLIYSQQTSQLRVGCDVVFTGNIKVPHALVVCTKIRSDGSARFRGSIEARAIRLEPDVLIDAR